MRTLLVGLLTVIFGTLLSAQPQQSEDFRITKSVLDAGGGGASSADFQLYSAFGQPTPIGAAASTDFNLAAGFLPPLFAGSPASPIHVVVQRQPALAPDLRLDWSAAAGASSFTIYRDVTPVFTPGPGNQIGTATSTTFIDAGAVSLPGLKYYYIVTASSGGTPTLRIPDNGPPGVATSPPANTTSFAVPRP